MFEPRQETAHMRIYARHTLFVEIVVGIALLIAFLLNGSPRAHASTITATVTQATSYAELGLSGWNHSHFLRITFNGRSVQAYCGEQLRDGPSVGTQYSGPYAASDELDYVLYHGYSDAQTSGYGISGYWFAMATTQAVWKLSTLAGNAGSTDETTSLNWIQIHKPEVYAAVMQMVDEARAYEAAGGNGKEKGAAQVWSSPDSSLQSLISVSKGTLTLTKTSANASITNNNSCYSLAGAEFSVTNASGSVVGTLITDEKGKTNTLTLAAGIYTVTETKAPEGYILDSTPKTVTVGTGATATVSFADEPANDSVSLILGKYDGQKTYSGDVGNLPQGSATLAGAEFTVEYYDTVAYSSYDALVEAGERPERTWTVATDESAYADLTAEYIVSGDEFYYASNGDVCLPRGTVAIYESKAPIGYLLNGDVSFQLIDEHISAAVTYNVPEIAESVYRSDFEFQKKDAGTGDVLANVAFKVTSQTTGESHVVVTDENGYFSSAASWNKHTEATNTNDWALSETGVIDSSKLNSAAGLWFGQHTIYDSDGSVATTTDIAADDARGALPFDTYTLEELRCTANEGRALITTSLTITRDSTLYDFGTLDDQVEPPVEDDPPDTPKTDEPNPEPDTPVGTSYGKTGGSDSLLISGIITGAVAAAGCACYAYTSRRKKVYRCHAFQSFR